MRAGKSRQLQGRGAGAFRGRWLVLVFLVLLAACAEQPVEALLATGSTVLPDSASATLLLQAADSLWLGAPGRVQRVDSAGVVHFETRLAAVGTPELLGMSGGRVYYRIDELLGSIDVSSGSKVERADIPGDLFLLDPHGRFIYSSVGAGALVAYDADTLEPLWGWAELGGPGTALAIAPQGHRLYQAIGTGGARRSPEVHVRDVQGGRILRTIELTGEAHALRVSDHGDLYGVLGRPGTGYELRAWRWEGGRLEPRWQRSLTQFGAEQPPRVEIAPSGRLLAVLAPEKEIGLHLLDVETGRSVKNGPGTAFDIEFDPADRVHLLQVGEIRRLE